MKKLLLPFLFIVFAATTYAQSGGPDSYGYIWRDDSHAQGPAFNWIDITTAPGAVQVAGLADDNTTSFIPIGFQFPYYWYTVSQLKIGSNGYVIFSNGAISSPFPAIPATALPNNYIAAFMCDLNFSDAGNPAQCWYWSNSVDTMIVSYIDVPFWINSTPPYLGANTFQIILSKVDSSITFQYDQQQGSQTIPDVTIGIENIAGTVGLQHSIDTYPIDSTAVKFYYPQNSTFAVNDAATVYNNNSETGALFLSKDGAPFMMNSRVTNAGNQALSSFNVHMRVLNSANSVQVQDTVPTISLAPGQTDDLVATDQFYPTLAGTYRFQNNTLLSGDATPTNNSKTLEIRVVDTTQNFVTLTYTGNTPVPPGSGISWQGGDAGVGVEIVPPYYPCYIRRIEYFITANTQASNFFSLVYDNTGSGNGPGNLLDSSYVLSGSVLINAWNVIDLVTPIQVGSGSLFVGWMMDGEGITLGTDNTSPISNRSYELLGGWSIYRSRETVDPMIRAVISSSPTTGIVQPLTGGLIGEFFPSPTEGKVSINLNLLNPSDISIFNFYDVQGKLVATKRIHNTSGLMRQTASFDLSNLDAGMYVCKIISGNQEFNKKLMIAY